MREARYRELVAELDRAMTRRAVQEVIDKIVEEPTSSRKAALAEQASMKLDSLPT